MYTQAINFLPILIGLVAVALIMGALVYAVIQVHRSYVKELDRRDGERLVAIDNERSKMAMDLHDDLSATIMTSRFCIEKMNTPSPDDEILQHEAFNSLATVSRRIRYWTSELTFPVSIEHGNFYELQEFINRTSQRFPIDITLQDFGWPELTAEQTMHVYRMLQEIVHNAIKHANARSMAITGKASADQLVLVTLDDGTGFCVEERERKARGMGLHNMRVRARLLKGTLRIDSAFGEGARHTITIPLKAS